VIGKISRGEAASILLEHTAGNGTEHEKKLHQRDGTAQERIKLRGVGREIIIRDRRLEGRSVSLNAKEGVCGASCKVRESVNKRVKESDTLRHKSQP